MFKNHKKYNLLYIIASPFFLAIHITIIIILFLPNHSSKYKAEFVESQITGKPDAFVYFYDLNNDGLDEMLEVFHNHFRGDAAFKVSYANGLGYDQWNFNGRYQTISQKHFVHDFNKDGFQEIVSFYDRSDSVFMSVIQPFPDKKEVIDDFFISTVNKKEGKIDYTIHIFDATDNDNDGYDELVIILLAGFSKQPRQLIIFDFQDRSILKSKSSAFNLSHMVIEDLDEDSLPEYYVGTGTTGNIPDTMNIPFSDYHSWLVGYNNKLELVSDPIINDDKPSAVALSKIKDKNGKTHIVAYFAKNGDKQDSIGIYETLEKQIGSYTIPFVSKSERLVYMIPYNHQGDNGLIISADNEQILFLNSDLEIITIDKPSDELYKIDYVSDLNNDGSNEYIFRVRDGSSVIICDNNFRHPVYVETNYELYSKKPYLRGKRNTPSGPEFYILSENKLYFYKYMADPLYYSKYLLWVLIYFTIVFILWSSQKLQKIQADKKQKIEDRINNLQFKTIKSQMEPHFMFNVLNGLAHNVAKGNSQEAHDQIIRFSKLLRTLMTRVDKLDISLKEELEFVRSYLELEKFRFKEDFNFSIEVEESSNIYQQIPRMLIQLLVENSIKHGLRNKSGKKELNISVKGTDNIIIIVEDNGVGRKEAAKYKRDSGQGVKLLKQMIELNKKSGGKDISFEYTDLYDEAGKAKGTRVDVVLG